MIVMHYDVFHGDDECVSHGKFNHVQQRNREDGYGMLQMYPETIRAMEGRRLFPPGTAEKFQLKSLVLETKCGLYDSNWKANPSLCAFADATKMSRAHFPQLCQQLLEALAGKGASSKPIVVACGGDAIGALNAQRDPTFSIELGGDCDWFHPEGLVRTTNLHGRKEEQIRKIHDVVWRGLHLGEQKPEISDDVARIVMCEVGISTGGFRPSAGRAPAAGVGSIRGEAGAATRRRNEAELSAEDRAKLVQERSDAATAGAATRRRNEAAMSAEDQAKLVQERSDRARRNGTNDPGFFDNFYSLVEWLEDHEYKYPAPKGKTPRERKLGAWITGVRSGRTTLDARRRRHLKAINFRWHGDRGSAGTVGKFPANWADQIED